ncbi:photosystem II protein, Psb35-related [Dapis sp. BLCC M229]|uniref:photosystem II protein, Psb35-related n=1 Tax=Dapis sp. BLCC M229 TaxID=3400188 RepID=UPI003CF291F9
MVILISLFVIAWVAAAVIGSQAYFLGEQTKPIHERNWNSESFENLSESLTGNRLDYNNRVPSYSMDAYASQRVNGSNA